jgi:putative glutamine amidotransferase
MPPIVAITAPLRTDAGATRIGLAVSYARAVERAGGLPVLVPPLTDGNHAASVLDAADGLLLTGGEDVDPRRYGAERHHTVSDISPERDEAEIALLESARWRGRPVFAICRGVQLLNVALGGTLVQDIPSQRPHALSHDRGEDHRQARIHAVRIERASRLAAALGVEELQVNSFHHQAPDRIADGLRATAIAPDGIVEGLEWHGEDWWAVGVQWHPEELDGRWEAGLFSAFIERAALAAKRPATPG